MNTYVSMETELAPAEPDVQAAAERGSCSWRLADAVPSIVLCHLWNLQVWRIPGAVREFCYIFVYIYIYMRVSPN